MRSDVYAALPHDEKRKLRQAIENQCMQRLGFGLVSFIHRWDTLQIAPNAHIDVDYVRDLCPDSYFKNPKGEPPAEEMAVS